MKNKLLLNKTYLYLLANYNNKQIPNATQLARETGLTRQTISKKIKELELDNIIVIGLDNKIIVDNVFNFNIEDLKEVLKTNYTIEDLLKLLHDLDNISISELCKMYGINMSTLYEQRNKKCVIYGIIYGGILKYIGSTDNYDERILQHIRKRNFLTRENFVIIKEVNNIDKLNLEKALIKTLSPEWNDMSI